MSKNLPEVVSGGSGFVSGIKRFFSVICRNDIAVSRTNEFFHMPILAFLIIMLLTFEVSVPVILISLFCGVEYTISGEDFPEPKKITFKP
ncbi:MAG: hypothetical protein ACI4J0_03440 [Huintestinicola sp.]|uniref:hypothetical protein n=1 Tax=Huintestinicola sp. TaxID=2981661 RepID=UPI003F098492